MLLLHIGICHHLFMYDGSDKNINSQTYGSTIYHCLGNCVMKLPLRLASCTIFVFKVWDGFGP